ncbi:MAG: LSU ribosomal protein L36p @ LSU ribosomal protein L36p, zinc-independent, partial [uncultured Acetobacteraceae bacterium]
EDPQQPEERQDARQELRAGAPPRPPLRAQQEESAAQGPPGL